MPCFWLELGDPPPLGEPTPLLPLSWGEPAPRGAHGVRLTLWITLRKSGVGKAEDKGHGRVRRQPKRTQIVVRNCPF